LNVFEIVPWLYARGVENREGVRSTAVRERYGEKRGM